MNPESAHVRDPREVTRLFGRIAPRYDLMNRLMSLGRDVKWRGELVARVADRPGPWMDLCTGTGDVALLAAAVARGVKILGIDGSSRMMRTGRDKPGAGLLLGWVQADAVDLPLRDGSLGAITVAFGVRNVARSDQLLSRLLGLLRPGGRLAVLDIFAPRSDLVGRCYDAYLQRAVPLLGAVVGGDAAAYRHLAASVKAFGRPEDLADRLARSGYVRTGCRSMNLGTIGLVWGERG